MRQRTRFGVLFCVVAVVSVAAFATSAEADPVVPTVTVGSASIVEGDAMNALVKVPIDLSVPTTVPVTVRFVVEGVNAVPGTDFVARKPAKLTFLPGTTSKAVTIKVNGDGSHEPDELIVVRVIEVVNGEESPEPGFITITDDDGDAPSATPEVGIGDLRVQEADAGSHVAYMSVTLSRPATNPVKLAYTSPCVERVGEYTAARSGTLTFNTGQRSKVMSFKILADTIADGPSRFLRDVKVTSGNATVNSADDEGEGQIVDDESLLPGMPVNGVEPISVTANGVPGKPAGKGGCFGASDFGSWDQAMNETGRYVAFTSHAALVPEDTNARFDVYVRDRALGTTERVSVTSDGSQTPPHTGSGAPYGGAESPSISADGRYVTFISIPEFGPAGIRGQLWLHDRATGTTEMVSVMPDGVSPAERMPHGSPASISADGRYVAFTSCDAGIVSPNPDPAIPTDAPLNFPCDVVVRDRVAGVTSLVSKSFDGLGADGKWPDMSPDGRYIAFVAQSDHVVPGDTNNCFDYFVHDRIANTTELVSVTTAGAQWQFDASDGCETGAWHPSISDDGNIVAFTLTSWAWKGLSGPDHKHNIWIRNRSAGTTTLVPAPDVQGVGQRYPSLSGDGTMVAYDCHFCDIWYGHPLSVYVTDLTTGTFKQVGTLPNGTLPDGNGEVTRQSTQILSNDGKYVVFASYASNLSVGDNNGDWDVYLQRVR